MNKLLPALAVATTMLASSVPAQAGGFYHGTPHGYYGHHHGYKAHRHFKRHHHAHRHYRHHRHHRHRGDEILLGAGIIGGAVIIGSVLSQPRHAPPPTVYYARPPQPYCVQDQVYRTLPDGSIQWGARTRCY